MPRSSQLLTTQNIKDLLNDREIEDLMKYSQFSSCKEKDYTYGKDELCFKLITLVIDKFN